jgi:hypothetical protein
VAEQIRTPGLAWGLNHVCPEAVVRRMTQPYGSQGGRPVGEGSDMYDVVMRAGARALVSRRSDRRMARRRDR